MKDDEKYKLALKYRTAIMEIFSSDLAHPRIVLEVLAGLLITASMAAFLSESDFKEVLDSIYQDFVNSNKRAKENGIL